MTTDEARFERIFNELKDPYTLHGGEVVTGQAISFLVRNVSRDTLPAMLFDAEQACEKLGFVVTDATNSRGQKTRVVTLL